MKYKIAYLITIFFFINTITADNNDELLNMLNELFETPTLQESINKNSNNEINQSNNEIGNEALKKVITRKSSQTYNEFITHINTYYPRIFVIREKFFPYMTPQDIQKAFQQIINIIAYKPWFYVEQLFRPIINKLESVDKKAWEERNHDLEFIVKKFKNKKLKNLNYENGFENFIADQLLYFHNFLKKAKVDTINNLVFYDNKFSSYMFKKNKQQINTHIPLKKYWYNNGITIHFDFYELCADYWSRLFVESINIKNLNIANRYLDDLKEILNHLKNSPQEAKLNEFIQNYNQIVKTLKSLKSKYKNDDKFSKNMDELIEFWES